jgi:DNA polymerase-3 subunit delta
MAPVTMKAFKSALESGRLDPVYLFHGTDDFLKEEKVRALVARATDPSTRDFNLEQLRGAECDAARLSGALEALPMLADRRVVILRDPDALKKPAAERLARHVEKPSSDTSLVLEVPSGTKPDAALLRGASAVEFRSLTEDELQQWLAQQAPALCGTSILPDAAVLLASYGGNDLAPLSGELQKLAAFTDGQPIDVAAVNAVTGVRPGHTLADLLDHAAARETTRAVAIVAEVLATPKLNGVQVVLALTAQTLAIGWGVAARARGLSAARLESEFFSLLKEGSGIYTGRAWGDAVKAWARGVPKWSAADVEHALPHLLAADAALKDTKVSSEAQIVTSLLLAITPTATRRRAA